MNRRACMDAVRRLQDDERGAVLLIGLFMALSLVGSLWFIMGIGDAIVVRDRGQELADAAALSSASIHARGMNFIAAVNVVMLCLAAFYLLVCAVGDLLFAIAALVALIPIVGPPAAAEVVEIGTGVELFALNVAKGLTVVVEGLGIGQAVVAMTAPWVGSTTGMDVASTAFDDHGQSWLALSFGPSNIPGFALSGGFSTSGGLTGTTTKGSNGKLSTLGGAGTTTLDPKSGSLKALLAGADVNLGLPVAFEKNQGLCVRATATVARWLVEKAMLVPAIERAMSIKLVSGVIADAIAAIANFAGVTHCNSAIKPWGLMGPKKMNEVNGGTGMQVFGVALAGTYTDDSDRKVMFAEGPKLGLSGVPMQETGSYAAQAEFFYDCGAHWSDDECNGDAIGVHIPKLKVGSLSFGGFDVGSYKWEHALYSIRWKARLRRYHSPSDVFAQNLVGRFVGFLFGSNVQSAIKGAPGARTVDKTISDWIDKNLGSVPYVGGAQGQARGQIIYDSILKTLFDRTKREVKEGIPHAQAASGAFH